MENIDMVFLFVIAAFVGYYMCKRNALDSFEGFAAIDDARQAVREVYNADIDAIRNLSTVATKLQAGGLTIPGNLTVKDAINVTDITTTKNLQVNGNINANSNITTNGNITATGGIVANNNIANGWITGHFGSGAKDRVVIGNLENQATVGAHNNALNAWTALRLQGDTINMVANNGVVTMQGRNILAELNNINSKFANMTASQVFSVNRGDGGWNGRTSPNFTVGTGKKIFQINLSLYVNGNNGVDINFYFSNGFTIWCGSYINHGGNHTGQSFTRVIENSQLPAGTYNVRVTCNLNVDGNDYLHASIITLPV